MKNIKIILFLILACSVFSCEDFLREEPRSFINPSTFFQTESDAEAAVFAGYDRFGGNISVTYGHHQDWIYEIVTDDFVTRPLGNPNQARGIANYTDFLPSTSSLKNAYLRHFNGINTFCVAVDGISGMEDFPNKNKLISEAKFLRAYAYFILVRLWGKVPLVDKSLEAAEVREMPRVPVDEIYELIIGDLTTGVNDGWESAPMPGRATKWAAMSYLAKVHLTRENWGEAVELAARVISESPHELLQDYEAVFSAYNENNAESIFELQFQSDVERSNQVGSWPRGVNADRTEDWFLGPNWGGVYIASDDFLNSFEDNDYRKTLVSTSVTRNDSTVINFWADGAPPYYPIKRLPETFVNREESNNNSSYNFISMRLAEVYLIAAEAENEANGPANAYQYINPIRERVGLEPLSGLTKEQFREAVRNERRHELFDERKRIYDLLRWGNLVERVSAADTTAQVQSHHMLWPIPQEAIDRNPALAGDQNPGY